MQGNKQTLLWWVGS